MNAPKKGITKEEVSICYEILDKIEEFPHSFDFQTPVEYEALGLTDYPSVVKTPMDLSTVRNKLNSGKYVYIQEVFNDIQLIWNNCKLYNREDSEIYKMAVKCERHSKKIIEKAKGGDKKGKKENASKKKKGEVKEKEKEMDKDNSNALDSNLDKEVSSSNKNWGKRKNTNESNINLNNVQSGEEGEMEAEGKIQPAENKIDGEINNLNYEPQVKQSSYAKDEEDEDPADSKYLSTGEREKLALRVRRLANDGLASLVRLIQKDCPNSIEENFSQEKLKIDLTEVDRKTYEQINALIDTFLKVRETNQENLGNKRARDKTTNSNF